MTKVYAKGRDGAGWYILEDGKKYLRHWVRYNLKEAALAEAARLFPGEELDAARWNGSAWELDR